MSGKNIIAGAHIYAGFLPAYILQDFKILFTLFIVFNICAVNIICLSAVKHETCSGIQRLLFQQYHLTNRCLFALVGASAIVSHQDKSQLYLTGVVLFL